MARVWETKVPSSVTVWMKGRLVSESYGEIVVSLSRDGLIALEPYRDSTGAPPVEVLRETNRLVGSGIPSSLGRFLCEQNRHVCVTSGKGVTEKFSWRIMAEQKPAEQKPSIGEFGELSIGGETCPSILLQKHVLCLPRLALQMGPGSITVPYKDGEDDLAEIVRATGACPSLDESCKRWVRRLNRRDDQSSATFPTGYTGPLVVPATEYRLELPVVSGTGFELLVNSIKRTIDVLSKRYDWPPNHRFVYYTVPSTPTQFGGFTEQPPTTQKTPLEVMNYPFRDRQAFMNEGFQPVVVGVWDRHVDADHCGYLNGNDRAIAFAQPLPTVSAGEDPRFNRVVPCALERTVGLSLKWDHGTHVTGLIASRITTGGIVGANPRAKIWAYEVSEERLQQEDPISQLAEDRSTPRMPDVINISMGEAHLLGSVSLSRLEQIVRGNSSQYLFVVSAGNAAENSQPLKLDVSGPPCRVMPACISLEVASRGGVISVVALNAAGTGRLTGREASNYGTAFDVAAVGEAVSTIDGDARGSMRGTSVAAPYVSALASLIVGKVGRQSPLVVKERMLYTADFAEGLDDLVKYGRIHFGRALGSLNSNSLNLHSLKTLPDASCSNGCEFKGLVRTLANDEIVVIDGQINGQTLPKQVPIKMADLRRISRVKANQEGQPPTYYVVFKENGELKKIVAASFDPLRKTLPFKADGQSIFMQIPVDSIEDYTCSFEHGKQ